MPFCSKCGEEIPRGASYCINCGSRALQSKPQKKEKEDMKETPTISDMEILKEMKSERPTGISILAVLQIIGGIFLFLLGLAAINILGILSVVIAILGPLSIVTGWGFWKGIGWSWTLFLIIRSISILIAVINLITVPTNIVSIILNALLIYYVFRPNVKAWFGKSVTTKKIKRKITKKESTEISEKPISEGEQKVYSKKPYSFSITPPNGWKIIESPLPDPIAVVFYS